MLELFHCLGFSPNNVNVFDEALTHPSVGRSKNYERLEFLGDAVIELVVTNFIFQTFPDYNEGRMTKLRARTVSRTSLAQFAQSINLGEHLKLSHSEQRNNGRTKDTNLCNALEALIGAIHQDQGYKTANRVVLQLTETSLRRGYLENETESENPKGRLQEILQALAPQSPVYQTLSESGPDHQKIFVSEVQWKGIVLSHGKGTSKKNAESDAARVALEKKAWL